MESTSPATRPWWRHPSRADWWALLVMVVVPAALFVVPALFAHPAISGDNLIQNFPLRVLVGRQIASGHLPLLNPLANSGTPLLGGLNAGAFYPFTFLFVVLPPIGAWVLNLILVYVIAAIGMFCLLRWHGIGTLSASAAALSFTYTGAMIDQLVHLGVVQGFALLPWELLILLSLSRRLALGGDQRSWREQVRAVAPWVVAYALLWGVTFLTGEPRAIAEVELVTLVVVPALLVLRSSYWMTTWRARVVYVLSLAVGLAWGVGIGLAQLLPGWSFIGFSQRSSISYSFFGAGSLAVHWTALLFIPDIFGGNGSLGQPGYYVNYNLAEVTGYAGVLALVATFAYLSRVTRRGWKGAERDFMLYGVLGVVGLFATWGSFTPLGHVFRAIPLFGSTRLQSRNVIIVDLAVSVLLGWWLDRIETRDLAGAGLSGRARWLTLAPAAVVVALSVALMLAGPSIVHYLGATSDVAHSASGQHASEVVHVFIAAAMIAVLLAIGRSTKLFTALLSLLVLDVVVFVLLCGTALVGSGNPTMPSRALALSLLGNDGRFALVNTGGDSAQYQRLGVPNMNVFTGIPSVQGYGSLISTIYDNSTGTHTQSALNACRLAKGTFTQLRLGSIAVSQGELMTSAVATPPPRLRCLALKVTPSTQRYFGQVLRVARITITGWRDDAVSPGLVSVRLLNSRGHLFGPTMSEPGTNVMTFHVHAGHDTAAGFEVRSGSGVLVADATVTTRSATSATYRLDTPFQQALSTFRWRLTTTVGDFAIFKANHLLPPEWLSTGAKGSSITHLRNATWGDTWVSVDATRPVVLKRSSAYLPGWRATALNVRTGHSVTLSVQRAGLIQRVTVPRGDWVVHFHYHAPYIELGLSVSIVSGAAMIGALVALALSQRRRDTGKVRS